jgi:hypothetical protein
VSYTLSSPATVTAELVNSAGVPTTLFVQPKTAGAQSFVFTPNGLLEGNYTIRLTARDNVGRQAQASVPVGISRTVLSFSSDSKIVSPNADGRRDTVNFHFVLTQPSTVALTLDSNAFSFIVLSSLLNAGPQTVAFNGKALDSTTVPDGTYEAKLTVGGVTQSLPLLVDRTPPTIALVSLSPLRLRVAERVSIIATLNGREIRASRPAGVFTLARNQKVRTLRVVARDVAGNESLPVTYPRK